MSRPPIPAAAKKLDHRARAERFHRRAQQAEGALERSHIAAQAGWRAFRTCYRKLKRVRAQLRHLRAGQPVAVDTLSRIIELGKLFP